MEVEGYVDGRGHRQEMITVLKSSAQNALMKAEEKKKLLRKALELKNQILDLADDSGDSDLKANLASELFNTSTAGGATKGWICSKHAIKHTTNESLPAVIVKLFSYAESLRHIHRTKQGSGSLGRETRTSSPLHDLLKRILELKHDVGIRVREARQAAPHGSNNLLLHQTQSALQLSRSFNGSLFPADEALGKCPYCNHDSVNFVQESLSFQENNETVLRKMEVWDKYQREKERAEGVSNRAMPSLPKDPHTKREMKMKPRAPGENEF